MKIIKLSILFVFIMLSGLSYGQAEKEFKVGVSEFKPFLYEEDGAWSGFDHLYINSILARMSESGVANYTLVEFDGVGNVRLFDATLNYCPVCE